MSLQLPGYAIVAFVCRQTCTLNEGIEFMLKEKTTQTLRVSCVPSIWILLDELKFWAAFFVLLLDFDIIGVHTYENVVLFSYLQNGLTFA